MKRMAAMVGLLLLLVSLACSGTDADLNRRVLVRLGREPTPTEQFTVSTHQRVVRLTGVVHSSAERERLERAAREVDGVAGVENLLVIDAPVELTGSVTGDPSATPPPYLKGDPVDSLLHDEIRGRLDAQALDDIAVEVRDRVITLKGSVPQDVHDAAMKIARAAGDGTQVDDRMRIIKP